jgi:hypothetical protein
MVNKYGIPHDIAYSHDLLRQTAWKLINEEKKKRGEPVGYRRKP